MSQQKTKKPHQPRGYTYAEYSRLFGNDAPRPFVTIDEQFARTFHEASEDALRAELAKLKPSSSRANAD